MRSIRRDTQFKRDVKRIKKRGKNIEKLKNIIHRLINAEKLLPGNKDHPLNTNFFFEVSNSKNPAAHPTGKSV